MRTALFWVIEQQVVVILVDVSEQHISPMGFKDPGTLSKETEACAETSVLSYHYLLRNNSEELSFQLLRGGSLKLH